MQLSRPPAAVLRPFISRIWLSDGGEPITGGSGRELMLPTGSLHIVLRLEDRPLRLFSDAHDPRGQTVGVAVVGGMRTTPYIKEASRPVSCVGALLHPGAAGLLIGAPASEFSERHTPLEDVWGKAAVERLRARLAGAGTGSRRLAIFEAALAERLPDVRHIDPRIALALAGFDAARPVAQVARQVGVSHRHFTGLFREAVGLPPKAYCRLSRFGRALDRLAGEPGIAWVDLAAETGFADQAHFVREFRHFAGLAPGDYRRRAPTSPRHVPV